MREYELCVLIKAIKNATSSFYCGTWAITFGGKLSRTLSEKRTVFISPYYIYIYYPTDHISRLFDIFEGEIIQLFFQKNRAVLTSGFCGSMMNTIPWMWWDSCNIWHQWLDVVGSHPESRGFELTHVRFNNFNNIIICY